MKMPHLKDVVYSQAECVNAVRQFYTFLSKMYLKSSYVVEPPEGGWPNINSDNLKELGKTDEVISLLRHLPYIAAQDNCRDAKGMPYAHFYDWQCGADMLKAGHRDTESAIICSQGFFDNIPPHVVGLADGEEDVFFLLDTKLGIIHWVDCPGEIEYNPHIERIIDHTYDWASENEEWRFHGPAWAIVDFFEVLKLQYRQLMWVPLSPLTVHESGKPTCPGEEGGLALISSLYRESGWPDLGRFNKKDCQKSIYIALKETYPEFSALSDYENYDGEYDEDD